MTDPVPSTSQQQLDRIEQLRRRRSPVGADTVAAPAAKRPRRRRRHTAQGSRIAAAGLGATVMFGIVTLLGLDNPFAQAESAPEPTPAPESSAPITPPIEVVIHWLPAPTVPVLESGPSVDEGLPAAADVLVEPPSTTAAPADPIVLSANPVVRTVTVADPAPSRGSSGGSSSPAPASPAPTPAATPAPAPEPAATTSGSH